MPTALAISAGLVMLAVLVHYEALNLLSWRLLPLCKRARLKIILGIFGALLAHLMEVMLFAAGYYLLLSMENQGSLLGHFDGSWFDCIYFSFTNFTTIGFGDIQPLGNVRLLVGLEGLTGLMLITWSASFMFIEMQKSWRHD